MIKDKEITLKTRSEIKVHKKYEAGDGIGSHLVNEKKKELYKYYICDCCGGEIELKENIQEQTGGVLAFRGMKLALHNICLKEVLKEYI